MHTPSSNRGLIVGAGIVGPALALALRRVGIEADVYESSPVPRDRAGAFLNVAPNGLKVLAALGLEQRVEKLGFLNDRLVFRNERGRMLAEAPVGGVTILRGMLGRVLREAAQEAGVRFCFGKRLESVQERDGVVIAAFADETAEYVPFLVGADGIHSHTRAAVVHGAPHPTYTGVLNVGGVVGTDLPSTGRTLQMIFGRRAFFGYAVRPGGETYWFSNFPQKEPPRLDGEMVDAERYRERLLEFHRDDPSEVTRILGAVRDQIGVYPVYEVSALPRWHEGSVCLVGDAAHAVGPHVGQGASLALEDAFVLAKCLRDVGTPASAFTAFEALRRERVERIGRQSRRTGERKAPSGLLARKLREFVLPRFLRQSARATQWLYSYPVEWDEPIHPSIVEAAR